VFIDERLVPLSGVNQRATLGLLLLNANKTVATSRFVKSIWGDDAPITSRKMVQNAVAGLRRLMSTSHSPHAEFDLVTSSHGYMLRVESEAVDLTRFRRHAAQGRAELAARLPEEAARTLAEGLALWRDSVLADLAEEGISWPAFQQLEKERLAAYEDWAEAGLLLGRHRELVEELDQVASVEPARERLCRQLMLALYRCDRQSESLAVYRRTRGALVELHGLDPSQTLQCMEAAILRQDPKLLEETPPTWPHPATASR
jgi:DNA-binding SARP family transcriptional activator